MKIDNETGKFDIIYDDGYQEADLDLRNEMYRIVVDSNRGNKQNATSNSTGAALQEVPLPPDTFIAERILDTRPRKDGVQGQVCGGGNVEARRRQGRHAELTRRVHADAIHHAPRERHTPGLPRGPPLPLHQHLRDQILRRREPHGLRLQREHRGALLRSRLLVFLVRARWIFPLVRHPAPLLADPHWVLGSRYCSIA